MPAVFEIRSGNNDQQLSDLNLKDKPHKKFDNIDDSKERSLLANLIMN